MCAPQRLTFCTCKNEREFQCSDSGIHSAAASKQPLVLQQEIIAAATKLPFVYAVTGSPLVFCAAKLPVVFVATRSALLPQNCLLYFAARNNCSCNRTDSNLSPCLFTAASLPRDLHLLKRQIVCFFSRHANSQVDSSRSRDFAVANVHFAVTTRCLPPVWNLRAVI